MYPVDTNALSSGAPGRREGAAALAEWLDARSDELFLSTITVAEVGDGPDRVLQPARTGPRPCRAVGRGLEPGSGWRTNMGTEIDIYSCEINLMAEKFRKFRFRGL